MHDKEVLHESADESTKSQCKILIHDPNGRVVKEHALQSHNAEDSLAFFAQGNGEYQVCVVCSSAEWFAMSRRKMRWSVAFDVLGSGGMGELDPKRLASLSHLKDTHATIEQVLQRVQAISTENEYEQAAERRFVKTSEAVNTDVAAFKVLQIMLVTGV
eukprot:CAMPEP_0198503674 /NCGR_PEP_ID=MMETSP1462-20131121/10042_1 /TAXON_ID=1333877 /ORGANISM="Brandtodinium nutriculum, Strain RCC3387" /LENGTH=158 /DNA_ID=CAMNT_0044232807 /DNA_START=13 /DNA_END=486 /DNA_ORIENTATION=+